MVFRKKGGKRMNIKIKREKIILHNCDTFLWGLKMPAKLSLENFVGVKNAC